jgi:hypothetical protein
VLLSLSFWAKADAGSVEKAVREIERAFDGTASISRLTFRGDRASDLNADIYVYVPLRSSVVEAVREFELHRSATAAYQTVHLCCRQVRSHVLFKLISVSKCSGPLEDGRSIRLSHPAQVPRSCSMLYVSFRLPNAQRRESDLADPRPSLDDLASHPALRSMKADFPKFVLALIIRPRLPSASADPFPSSGSIGEYSSVSCSAEADADRELLRRHIRKVALCYIKAEDFDRAKEKLRACPWDESATHYLRFMLYAQRGKPPPCRILR